MTAAAWLPDWHEVCAYPEHRSGAHWAWEFLRRNPRYQRLFEAWIRSFIDADGAYNHEAAMDARHARHPDAQIILNPDRSIGRRFGLLGVRPPEADSDPHYRPIFLRTGMVSELRLLGFGPAPKLRRGEWAYVFRLGEPLEPQFRRIERLVRLRAKSYASSAKLNSRAHWSKFALYLRTLDAVASGASWNEIACVLHPDQENSVGNGYAVSRKINQYYRAAVRIRDGGYRYLGTQDQHK